MAEPTMLQPGRTGLAEGPAGVTVTPLATVALAAISARAGAEATLAARLHTALGLELPTRPACTAAAGVTLVWSGPGQWLALQRGISGPARFGFAPHLAAALGEAASVTEMTGSRALLRLGGAAAREALSKIVPIDLDDAAFPDGAAALTNGGYMPLQLWRPPGGEAVFELACYRSYGESLMEAVLHAAREFGCEVRPAA